MRDLRLLPKGHLHLHLEGAMRRSTLEELAREAGIVLPDLGSIRSFAGFMELYRLACTVVRHPHHMHRLVLEVAEDAAADGARWVEVQVYPPLHRGRLGDDEAVLTLVLEACAAARNATAVDVGVVLAADRTLDVADAVLQARLAVACADQGVVAYGLANDEVSYPPEPFADAFAIAREGGLLSVPHAGELVGPESVRGALDTLAPDRLGHGVRAVEDPSLVARLADSGTCLDVCPSSNLALALYPSMEEHPLGALLEAGVPVSLNADDPLLFGPGLLDQYELARSGLSLGDDALAAIARTSISASAIPADRRLVALRGIDDWLASPA